MPDGRTISDSIKYGATLLANVDRPRSEAETILCHVLDCSQVDLITYPDKAINKETTDTFLCLIQRRSSGEPLAYVLGKQGFWNHDFIVSPEVLIPRPESELMVETALREIERLTTESDSRELSILDLGTGSGAIGLSLAYEHQDANVVLVDASDTALEIAQQNKTQLALDNVELKHGSWYEPVRGRKFDLIVSNPPYIEPGDPCLESSVTDFEPHLALFAVEDGLTHLTTIIQNGPHYLNPKGCLMVEHGFQQGSNVRNIFLEYGFKQIQTMNDLAGHERMTWGVTG